MPLKCIACLLALFVLFSSLQAGEWLHARSTNFEVFSSAGRGATEALVRDLEDIQHVFGEIFAKKPKYNSRIMVVFCGNGRDLKPYQRIFQGKPVEIAGYYMGPVDYPAIVLEDGWTGDSTRRVIYHEMGHAFLAAVVPGIPLWFDEGLAQVFEQVEVDKKGFTYGRHDEEAVALLRSKSLIPLRTILGTTHNSKLYNHGDKRDLLYAQSWAFVHMCFFGSDTTLRPKLMAFLSGEGGEPDKAAFMERLFGTSLENLDRELIAYVTHGKYRYFDLPFTNKPELKLEFLPLFGCEMDAVRYSIQSRVHGGSELETSAIGAFRLLADTDNAALCAWASLHARDLRETALAETLAERAVALGFDHPRLYFHKVIDEVAQMPRTATYRMPEAEAERLRKLVDRAMELYPGNIELLKRLAYVEAFAPRLRKEKLKLIESVVRLTSDRRELLVLLAYIRWHYKDAATARQMLDMAGVTAEGISDVAGLGGLGELARELNDYLKAGKPWKPVL